MNKKTIQILGISFGAIILILGIIYILENLSENDDDEIESDFEIKEVIVKSDKFEFFQRTITAKNGIEEIEPIILNYISEESLISQLPKEVEENKDYEKIKLRLNKFEDNLEELQKWISKNKVINSKLEAGDSIHIGDKNYYNSSQSELNETES